MQCLLKALNDGGSIPFASRRCRNSAKISSQALRPDRANFSAHSMSTQASSGKLASAEGSGFIRLRMTVSRWGGSAEERRAAETRAGKCGGSSPACCVGARALHPPLCRQYIRGRQKYEARQALSRKSAGPRGNGGTPPRHLIPGQRRSSTSTNAPAPPEASSASAKTNSGMSPPAKIVLPFAALEVTAVAPAANSSLPEEAMARP